MLRLLSTSPAPFLERCSQAICPQTLQGLPHSRCVALHLPSLNFLTSDVESPHSASSLRCLWLAALLSSVWTHPRFSIIPPNDKDVLYPIVHTLDEDIEQHQSQRKTTCTWLPLWLPIDFQSPTVQFFIHLVAHLSRHFFFYFFFFKFGYENTLDY